MNTPKSQNPEGKVVAVGYISLEALAALNACRNDEHNGCADIWMRPVNADDVPLISATTLTDMKADVADARRTAQYWKDCHLAGSQTIDDMQRRLEAALGLTDEWERVVKKMGGHDTPHTDAAVLTCATELRAILRGDGKGDGVSTDGGEGK